MRLLLLAGLLTFAACKLPSRPARSDAGATATALTASSSSAPRAPEPRPGDAGAAMQPPLLPTVTEDLQLVAVGKKPGSKIVWLKTLGSRVWLSGTNLDAYADGDGLLTKAPDLLKGLPYNGAAHEISVGGAYPRLVAVRTKKHLKRAESPEATAFVLGAGKWVPAQRLPQDVLPLIVPWGEGALLVWSGIRSDAAIYEGGKGTDLQYIGPDGHLTEAKLGLDPKIMTWDASSDGTTLSLLATRGGDKREGDTFERGVWLVRGTKEKGMTSIPIADVEVVMSNMDARVIETGTSAYVSPPGLSGSMAIWSAPATGYTVSADGKPRPRKIGIGCRSLGDSVVVESTIYATVNESCNGAVRGEEWLVRVAADGTTERVALPSLVKGPNGYRAGTADEAGALRCEPHDLVLRPPNDLWVRLWCGIGPSDEGPPPIPAVVRLGHAQTPITLP